MGKVNKFFTNHGSKVIVGLLVLIYFKSCGVDNELVRVKDNVIQLQGDIDSVNVNISNLPTNIDIEIEGLKTEKRLIQATDRKIFDVNRQNQIEKQIKVLEKNK
ncbi:hypothetical protein N9E79_00955 [bacterium]|nr:hypothetical protein [bacterium]